MVGDGPGGEDGMDAMEHRTGDMSKVRQGEPVGRRDEVVDIDFNEG